MNITFFFFINIKIDFKRKKKEETLISSMESCIFFPLNNREKDIKKSGVKSIFDIISNEYNKAESTVSTTLRHFSVLKEIEKLSGNKDIQNESTTVNNFFIVIFYKVVFIFFHFLQKNIKDPKIFLFH